MALSSRPQLSPTALAAQRRPSTVSAVRYDHSMATRPVFLPAQGSGLVREEAIQFEWFPGFSLQQKQRSIEALHTSAKAALGIDKLLEVSTKSPTALGRSLSAFNLKLGRGGSPMTVESAYQGSKVFRSAGPHPQLYRESPRIARDYIREHTDPRELIGFNFLGTDWLCHYPTVPSKTAFYDWLYIAALTESLSSQPRTAEAIASHDGFTDIEFNPVRSLGTQARSCALYTTLQRSGSITTHVLDRDDFLEALRRHRPQADAQAYEHDQFALAYPTTKTADSTTHSSDREQLQAMVQKRGIRRLCHFSPADSLPSIITDRRILSRRRLLSYNPKSLINDQQRLDGHVNHVCASIEYPNLYVLNEFRQRYSSRTPYWLVFLIEPPVLYNEGVLFAPQNAARALGSEARSGCRAFEALFRREMPVDERFDDRVTTDIQAEVLVPESISLDHVYEIVVETPRGKQQVEAALSNGEVRLPVIVEPKFFSLDHIKSARSQSLSR